MSVDLAGPTPPGRGPDPDPQLGPGSAVGGAALGEWARASWADGGFTLDHQPIIAHNYCQQPQQHPSPSPSASASNTVAAARLDSTTAAAEPSCKASIGFSICGTPTTGDLDTSTALLLNLSPALDPSDPSTTSLLASLTTPVPAARSYSRAFSASANTPTHDPYRTDPFLASGLGNARTPSAPASQQHMLVSPSALGRQPHQGPSAPSTLTRRGTLFNGHLAVPAIDFASSKSPGLDALAYVSGALSSVPGLDLGSAASRVSSEAAGGSRGAEPETDEEGRVRAYAKLEFPEHDFFVRKLSIRVGRRPPTVKGKFKGENAVAKIDAVPFEKDVVANSETKGEADVVGEEIKANPGLEAANNEAKIESVVKVKSEPPVPHSASQLGGSAPPTPPEPHTADFEPDNLLAAAPEIEDDIDVDLGPIRAVSRDHARIFFDFSAGAWALEVRGRNGCVVEGRWRARGEVVMVGPRTKIQIAERIFFFVLPSSDPPPPPPGSLFDHHPPEFSNTDTPVTTNIDLEPGPYVPSHQHRRQLPGPSGEDDEDGGEEAEGSSSWSSEGEGRECDEEGDADMADAEEDYGPDEELRDEEEEGDELEAPPPPPAAQGKKGKSRAVGKAKAKATKKPPQKAPRAEVLKRSATGSSVRKTPVPPPKKASAKLKGKAALGLGKGKGKGKPSATAQRNPGTPHGASTSTAPLPASPPQPPPLWPFPTPPTGADVGSLTRKPPYTYASLIAQSLAASESQDLPSDLPAAREKSWLSQVEICTWISRVYPYFSPSGIGAKKGTDWQSSVRHNLHSDKRFEKREVEWDEQAVKAGVAKGKPGQNGGTLVEWRLRKEERGLFTGVEFRKAPVQKPLPSAPPLPLPTVPQPVRTGGKPPIPALQANAGTTKPPLCATPVAANATKPSPAPAPCSQPNPIAAAASAHAVTPTSIAAKTTTAAAAGVPAAGALNPRLPASTTAAPQPRPVSTAAHPATHPATPNSNAPRRPTAAVPAPIKPAVAAAPSSTPTFKIVISPLPESAKQPVPPSAAQGTDLASLMLRDPPMVSHQGSLVLNPKVFSHLKPEQVASLEKLGPEQSLKILQSFIVEYYKETMKKEKKEKKKAKKLAAAATSIDADAGRDAVMAPAATGAGEVKGGVIGTPVPATAVGAAAAAAASAAGDAGTSTKEPALPVIASAVTATDEAAEAKGKRKAENEAEAPPASKVLKGH